VVEEIHMEGMVDLDHKNNRPQPASTMNRGNTRGGRGYRGGTFSTLPVN